MSDNLDKLLSDYLKNEADISPKRNITEAAILNVTKRKNEHPKKLFSLKYVAVIACIAVTLLGGMLASSAETRTSVRNLFQSVFTLEKQADSYAIVEKNADEDITWENFGGIPMDQFTSTELADKLGFMPFIPETINSNPKNNASVGITITGKSSDLISLRNSPDKLMQSIKDDSAFEKLQEYNPLRFLTVSYSANGEYYDETQILLSMSKATNRKSLKTLELISEFEYKDVKCSYIDDIRPNYQRTQHENTIYDDPTKKPDGIVHIKHITFDLDGVHYSTASYKQSKGKASFDEVDYDSMVLFVKDYIDAYMNRT